MNLTIRFREAWQSVAHKLLLEVEQWVVSINRTWRVQHADDGTHGAVTATSVTATGGVSGATLTGTLQTAAQPNVTSVGTLASLVVAGDVTVDTSTLKVDSANGNVGIGTTSPSYALDVNSNVVGIGPKSAATGAGGNTRYRDDTSTERWLVGLLGTAGATSFVIYDIVSAASRLAIDSDGNAALTGGYLQLTEMAAPAAGSSNTARLFCQDNGAGKTQLCVRFPTGAVQVIATEP